ncbi:hypothetical protein NA57DRAFT_70227 [Rhizodiscina lignyota]|uniref:RRM domain-containing protein n=1 Tax=Rhizodiscina lignyota TaxID=1504668 RepID=A0A9P4IQP2_9PEZI|nr:hypothetical protein NA57DRAFT_70227 [Rhizodiscina lignyota]
MVKKKQGRKEKSFETGRRRRAELVTEEEADENSLALRKEWLERESKRQKMDGVSGDGNQEADFIPFPTGVDDGPQPVSQTDELKLSRKQRDQPMKKEKKKKSKKEQKKAEKLASQEAREEPDANGTSLNANEPSTLKKSKKRKRNEVEDAEGGVASLPQSDAPASEHDGKQPEDSSKGSHQRFIVFVGNLPYLATAQSIKDHFKKIAPFKVRLSSDKKTGMSNGYAFLEFDRFDRMKTCLELYHHSHFIEGKDSRKINVELTAGGGGHGEARKSKIQAKNEKLQEERSERKIKERRREESHTRKIQKQTKKRKEMREKRHNRPTGANGTVVGSNHKSTNGSADQVNHDGIHPSRRAQMQT